MTAVARGTTAEPEQLALPDRLSMSFIQDAAKCLRMADLKRRADTSGEDATVGSVLHEVGAFAGMRAARLGVDRLDADELERLAREVLRSPGDGVKPLSLDGWRTVIRLARRLAYVYSVGPPPFPIGAEYEVYATRELDGRTISSRTDWRWLDERERVGWVADYKAGGRMAADEITFQGRMYCWQWLGTRPDIREFWFAEHALPYGGPGWVWIAAEDLEEEFEDYLSDTIARLEAAYASPPLAPTPGSWCKDMCPDRAGCPLPEWAKDQGIGGDEDARRAVDAIVKGRADSRGTTKDLKAYLIANELTHVKGSGDMEYGFNQDGSKCEIRKASKHAERADT